MPPDAFVAESERAVELVKLVETTFELEDERVRLEAEPLADRALRPRPARAWVPFRPVRTTAGKGALACCAAA